MENKSWTFCVCCLHVSGTDEKFRIVFEPLDQPLTVESKPKIIGYLKEEQAKYIKGNRISIVRQGMMVYLFDQKSEIRCQGSKTRSQVALSYRPPTSDL